MPLCFAYNRVRMVFYLTLIIWIYITVFRAFSINLAFSQFTIIANFCVTGAAITVVTAFIIFADMFTWCTA